MRILCLHGYGTSGAILENQMRSLIRFCDETYEFVFLNGETECQPARGLDGVTDGPFLCYCSDFSPSNVHKACTLIDEIIKDEGDFDGVIGFSQGGSLALTYLLKHQVEAPYDPPPFRFAVLCSTVVAFSPWESFGQDVLESLSAADHKILSSFPHCDFTQLEGKKRTFCETLAATFESARNGGFIDKNTDGGKFAPGVDYAELPRVIHPALLPATIRIQIPTVHVTGIKDDATMVKLSKLMVGLCDKRGVQELQHSGGHDMPKDNRSIKSIVRAIEDASEKGLRQSLV